MYSYQTERALAIWQGCLGQSRPNKTDIPKGDKKDQVFIQTSQVFLGGPAEVKCKVIGRDVKSLNEAEGGGSRPSERKVKISACLLIHNPFKINCSFIKTG